jgi:hypothetical protein
MDIERKTIGTLLLLIIGRHAGEAGAIDEGRDTGGD